MNSLDKCAIIIEQICGRIEPGKKMIQKLLYLIERKGVQLGLNYSIHFFGPYSSRLDDALHILENYGFIEIDTSSMTHVIKSGNVRPEGTLLEEEQRIVDEIIQTFASKTALELEAITTLDYAATTILNSEASDDDIVEQVLRIKGGKFTREYLKRELDILQKNMH